MEHENELIRVLANGNTVEVNESVIAASKLKTFEQIYPKGSILNPAEFLGAPYKGRKITILGDTFDPGFALKVAQGSDVLVHEATSLNANMARALSNGHSTAGMAARVASKFGVNTLLLNHIGSAESEGVRQPYDLEGALLKEAKSFFNGEIYIAEVC